jgi:myo-inositol-1(or 4)-monophosphatase
MPASALMNVMLGAARKAGRSLARDFGEVEQLQVSRKGPADFVSVADEKAERILKEELQKARPTYGFLMEESGETPGTDGQHRWIVDPLDGTTNFLHGLPHFCISVALERAGEIVAGVILDPIKDELYWAERGVGAYLNDRRIRVSSRRNLGEALLATGIPFQEHGDHSAFATELTAVMPKVAGVRRFGAAALDLAYVAAGRYEGFWESGLSPWDMAAGILLVREAGGYVTEIGGGEKMLDSGSVLAANDKLHSVIQRLLSPAEGTKRPRL